MSFNRAGEGPCSCARRLVAADRVITAPAGAKGPTPSRREGVRWLLCMPSRSMAAAAAAIGSAAGVGEAKGSARCGEKEFSLFPRRALALPDEQGISRDGLLPPA